MYVHVDVVSHTLNVGLVVGGGGVAAVLPRASWKRKRWGRPVMAGVTSEAATGHNMQIDTPVGTKKGWSTAYRLEHSI